MISALFWCCQKRVTLMSKAGRTHTPSSSQANDRSSGSLSPHSADGDVQKPAQRIDQFLLMHSARLDQWRDITVIAEAWQAGTKQREDLENAVQAMEAVEGYHAYPG